MWVLSVDVVVVNYRTPDLLIKFVESYRFQSSKVDSELIIVDVDPTPDGEDQVKQYLSKLDFKFQYWFLDYNAGYSGACNFASASCTGDVIAFFNADTQLHDTTLDDVYCVLMANDAYGIAGPKQIDSRGRITHAGIFGTNTKPELVGFRSRDVGRFSEVRDDAVSVSGSAFFVKRHVWDRIASMLRMIYPNAQGAMLPTKHYYEETFVSYMARHLGYKVVYVGSTIMIHEWNQSGQNAPVNKLAAESRKQFREALDHFGVEHD